MILAKLAILEALREGRLTVSPMDSESLQPASIDLRLGTNFLVPRDRILDPHPQDLGKADLRAEEASSMVLQPGEFVLARTVEVVKLAHSISGFVEGRSSVGRGGLFIHNAGFIDPGFEGTITLELFNAFPTPIRIWAGRRICQIVLMECVGESGGYQGKYQGQIAATSSRFDLDAEVFE